MNRENYSTKTLSVFDTVGAFFVDIYYNKIYAKAKDLVQENRAHNITEAYRASVSTYMNGIKKPELYNNVVRSLHDYYQRNSGFSSIILSEFQDKFLSQFIPKEYYDDFTEQNKDATLKTIIVKTVNNFGVVVIGGNMLRRIIDEHNCQDNITILLDKMMEIFIIQREDYYAKFVKQINKRNTNNSIDKKVFEKLKKMFVEEKQRSVELSTDKMRALNIIQQMVDTIKQYEKQLGDQKELIDKLSGENSVLKQDNLLLNSQINEKSIILDKLLSGNLNNSNYSNSSNYLNNSNNKQSTNMPKISDIDIDTDSKKEQIKSNNLNNIESSDSSDDSSSDDYAYAKQKELLRNRRLNNKKEVVTNNTDNVWI